MSTKAAKTTSSAQLACFFAAEADAIAYINSGRSTFRMDYSRKRGQLYWKCFSCRSHVNCRRAFKLLWKPRAIELHDKELHALGDRGVVSARGIDDRLRPEFARRWEPGTQPEQALNELSQQYSGSYLEPYLPYLSQVHNLWNRMRKCMVSKGFQTCEAFRLDPAYQLPQDLSELQRYSDSDLFATRRVPSSKGRWGVGLVSKSMIQQLGRQVNFVRRHGASITISADAVFKIIKDVDSHALLVVGVHRLQLNKQKRSAHSFSPLLFFLCDSESQDNYEVAFRLLEEMAEHYFSSALSPDVVRGDHHKGLRNAVLSLWPGARFSVCRTHAYQSVREHSRSMNAEHREIWLRAWRLLEQSGSQAEFHCLLPTVVSFLRLGFRDDRAALVLEGEWGHHMFNTWYVSASGVACSPPDNNCLESYQRIVSKCLGGRSQPLSALLPRYFERLVQREVPARRDTSLLSETRVPWFADAQSLRGAQELIRTHAAGTISVLQLATGPERTEYAVSSGDSLTQEPITEHAVERRRRCLHGDNDAELPKTNDLVDYLPEEGIEEVRRRIDTYERHARAVHIVSSCASMGGPTGIDGWSCDCKAWWDNGQCKHILAVASVHGELHLWQEDGLSGGRPQERRPAKVQQPRQGQALRPKDLSLDPPELNEANSVPVVGRASREKARNTRPKERDRGRAKQRKKKGKRCN